MHFQCRKYLKGMLIFIVVDIWNCYNIHLRGGIDYSKLNFKHKTMMKMLYHSLKNKPVESLTQEDKALIETYNTKVDFVDYDSLKQIVEVIQ